jgi:chromosome segregation ATPase
VKELKDMELSYSSLKGRVAELENVLSHTRQERDELSGRVIELQLQIDTLVEEQEILQNVDVEKNRLKEECESLKLRLESLQTEKSEVPSLPTIITTTDSSSMHQTNQMKEEYDHFQETNQHLQSEIESLRTCIDDQTAMNDELQRQVNTFQQLSGQKLPGDNLSIDQIQASGYFETTPGHGNINDIEP